MARKDELPPALLAAHGRNDGVCDEVIHDQVADWVPYSISLPVDRKSAGRDHDAHRIGVRVHPGQSRQDLYAGAQ